MAGRVRLMPLLLLAAVFIALTLAMPALAPVFSRAFPDVSPPIYPRESFFILLLSHAGFVAFSGLISTLIGVSVGIGVTRRGGAEFRPIVNTLAVIGQTFPPAAVLALAVPAVGFGAVPTIIALTLYGVLPILQNTIAGVESVPANVREAAEGSGLSPFQVLRAVELPLAAPSILTGIRISVIIAIGTATIGSTVGALTLGAPIISGLYSEKLSWVIQGAAVVGLFAIVTDMAFGVLIRWMSTRR